nr:hypothetical protein [Tanacetum cinerariifolium]
MTQRDTFKHVQLFESFVSDGVEFTGDTVGGGGAWEVEEERDAVWALDKREFEVGDEVAPDERGVVLGDEVVVVVVVEIVILLKPFGLCVDGDIYKKDGNQGGVWTLDCVLYHLTMGRIRCKSGCCQRGPKSNA